MCAQPESYDEGVPLVAVRGPQPQPTDQRAIVPRRGHPRGWTAPRTDPAWPIRFANSCEPSSGRLSRESCKAWSPVAPSEVVRVR